jgi:hypothetical protein
MIEADYDTLLRQATMTAHDYLLHAIADIDKVLGKGYAKDPPELIAAYMQTPRGILAPAAWQRRSARRLATWRGR